MSESQEFPYIYHQVNDGGGRLTRSKVLHCILILLLGAILVVLICNVLLKTNKFDNTKKEDKEPVQNVNKSDLMENQELKSESICNNIVPGITRMSRGLDITTLDLVPSDILRNNGFRNSLFEFSCAQTHTWTHPTIDNYSYNLPDQIAAINTLPAGALTVKTNLHQNLNEYKESLAASVCLDLTFGFFGSFSLGGSYLEAKEHILGQNKSIFETSAYVSAVQIDFQSAEEMRPNRNFQNYINKKLFLHNYSDNPDVYHKFIQTFGTHYFESATFGGYLYEKTVIENDFKNDHKTISAKLKAKFLLFITAGGSFEQSSTISHDEKFKSDSDIYFYGGSADFTTQPNADYLAKWSQTVHKDPWLFAGKLVPIENLISNERIKIEVKKAIFVHRIKAYYEDLKSTLYLSKLDLPQKNMQILTLLESKIENNNNLTNSNLDQSMKLKVDIDSLFERVQETKDRALLTDISDQMDAKWNTTFKCKYMLATVCKSSPMAHEIQEQKDAWDYVKVDKIDKLLKLNSKPDSKEVRELVQAAHKLIHFHETANVDLCQGVEKCLTCLKDYDNCSYSNGISNSWLANSKLLSQIVLQGILIWIIIWNNLL